MDCFTRTTTHLSRLSSQLVPVESPVGEGMSAGNISNAAVCCVVSVSSVWLLVTIQQRKRRQLGETDGQYRYQATAVALWLANWLTWSVVWVALTIVESEAARANWKQYGGDLSTSILITFAIVIIGGASVSRRRALIQGLLVAGGLVAARLSFVFLEGLSKLSDPGTEQVGAQWTISLSSFAPALAGWAIWLRWRSGFALVAGLMYGVAQPLVYAATNGGSSGAGIATGVAMLKVIWASSFVLAVSRHQGVGYKSLFAEPQPVVGEKSRPVATIALVQSAAALAIVYAATKLMGSNATDRMLLVAFDVLILFVGVMGAFGLIGRIWKWMRDHDGANGDPGNSSERRGANGQE
ncbi:MAG: hypothetical protein AAF726_19605 [Planctomycetota bacterium]